METENKRRFTRISINRPVLLTLYDGSVSQSEEILDLGIGGCLLAVTIPISKGERCSIEISLGGEPARKICIDGIIVRSDEQTAAVKFDGINPDSLFLLQNLIRYNASDPEIIDEEISAHPGIV